MRRCGETTSAPMYYMCVLFVRPERLPILEQYETMWQDYQSTYVLYVCVVCEGRETADLGALRDDVARLPEYLCIICACCL